MNGSDHCCGARYRSIKSKLDRTGDNSTREEPAPKGIRLRIYFDPLLFIYLLLNTFFFRISLCEI